jgi:DNA-binding transcriptional ArsR family regulator
MQDSEIIELSHSTSNILRTLGHEHRFAIIGLLCKQELCVGDLEKLLQLTQPAVSQQLAKLRSDGLVYARRQGRTIYYYVERTKIKFIIDVFANIIGNNTYIPENSTAEDALVHIA